MLLEHLAHPLALLAVREHRNGGADVAVLLELADDLEQVVLGVVEQHQPAGSHPGDLPAQLRADRTARTGDEHDLLGQVGAHPLDLHPHGLAAEDVLDPHLAKLAGDLEPARAVPQQLEHGRRRPNRDPAGAARGDHPRSDGPGRGRNRDHDLVRLDVVEDPVEVLAGGGA